MIAISILTVTVTTPIVFSSVRIGEEAISLSNEAKKMKTVGTFKLEIRLFAI